MTTDAPSNRKPLSDFEPESVVYVESINAEGEDGIRLKRLGICEGRRIQLVQVGDPLVIRVVGCRVGISRRLASDVLVSLCADCIDPSPRDAEHDDG